jgi:hypothetical protein
MSRCADSGKCFRRAGRQPGVAWEREPSKYGVVFAVPYGTLIVFVGIAVLPRCARSRVHRSLSPARRAATGWTAIPGADGRLCLLDEDVQSLSRCDER